MKFFFVSFEDHLTEMLETSRPGWDKDNEYRLETVDLYFIDMKKSGYVKIDIKESLANVLTSERYGVHGQLFFYSLFEASQYQLNNYNLCL